MMSLGELQISFPLFFVPKIHFCFLYQKSWNFDSEKVDQDEVFYYKDILHFFLEWLKYHTYQNHICGTLVTF
jgi:hypothetical protein